MRKAECDPRGWDAARKRIGTNGTLNNERGAEISAGWQSTFKLLTRATGSSYRGIQEGQGLRRREPFVRELSGRRISDKIFTPASSGRCPNLPDRLKVYTRLTTLWFL